MKITLRKILAAKDALQRLIDKEINIKLAFKLAKIIKEINGEFSLFEERRVSLIKKYSDKPDKDGSVKVKPENIQAFAKELNELEEIEVDLNFKPMKLDEFGNIEMATKDLIALEDFIKE